MPLLSNGNQTHRLVHTIVNGQPVTQEFELGYDADREAPLWGNRLVSVTGVNGATMSAVFTDNGDACPERSVVLSMSKGRRRQKVKSVINSEPILLVGGHFEQKGSEIRYREASRRDEPWGEVRFTTANQTLPTRYSAASRRDTFTSQ